MTTDFRTILPEIIVQKIIQKTISEFENKYLCINYNNEAVYTGLKLKPKMLMKKVFSDVFYFLSKFKDEKEHYDDEENFDSKEEIAVPLTEYEINKKLLEIYEKQRSYFNEIEKNIFINYLKTILINIKKIDDQSSEIFNYINSCFKSLYSCTYEQYIKILKKKIFLHYGEDTIHHYSYLKKSSIDIGMIKLKHFDNPSLKKIFENNNKFYWLYLSMINDIDKIKNDKDNYEFIHLKYALMKHGLSNKGWRFLQMQNQHYITRMGQSITWSVFCVNYGLKDAWLRNNKHKYLFNRMKFMYSKSDIIDSDLKRIYFSLGKSCSKWQKPVTKFCMISSYRLKLLISYIAKNSNFENFITQCLERKEIDYNKDYYYIACLKNYDEYVESFFLAQIFGEVLKYMQYNIKVKHKMPLHLIFKEHIQTIHGFDLKEYHNYFDFEMCYENFKELDPVAYQHLKKLPELVNISKNDFLFTYLELKDESKIHRKNIYLLLILKLFRDLIYSNNNYSIYNKYIESINKIKKTFGESSFSLIHTNSMKRKVCIEEFKAINNDIRVINDNNLLFNDFINLIPFNGDNYLKDVKLYLNNKGLTHNGWTHMLKEYKKCKSFSFIDVIIPLKNSANDLRLKFAIDLFNHNIPFKYFKFINKYFYAYISNYHSDDYESIENNINVFCSAFYHSFISLINGHPHKGRIKNDYIFSNIISASRGRYYLEYIKHNNAATLKDMFERDIHIIYDYVVEGCQNDILPKSGFKKLLEKANKWHEDNFTNNLVQYEYIEEEINSISIDQEYTFIQIKNTDYIAQEAHDMKHCIARYNERCARNEYVAYHMSSKKGESATLGIKKMDDGYIYEQLYSFRNRPVSKEARNAAKYLIELLNKIHVNKNNNSSYRIAA